MDFSRDGNGPGRKFGGLSTIILVHALLAYALVTGLAHRMVGMSLPPVVAKIIDESPPPPPPEEPPPPPHMEAAPPPPWIPPPEVAIQQPQPPNTITAVTSTPPPAPQAFTPAPVPVPVATEPAEPRPVPAFADLNACKPEYPRAALMKEETGTVRVQFVIGPVGQLLSARVVKSSGYRDLDQAAVDGLSRCKFKAAYQDGKPIQSALLSDYVWRLDQ